VPNPVEDEVNLEHVMPLNPSSEWKIDEDEATGLHKRLGNLALLSSDTNRDIGNLGFKKKKRAFSKSSFAFTSCIAECSKWTKKEIEDRQARMAETAVSTWPLRLW
jgi:hypothetical protein